MATPGPADRIRAANAEAAEKMARQPVQPVGGDAPTPGNIYVFDAGDDVGLEWMVVRLHPDDSSLLLLAPMDDFSLVGTPDLELPREVVGRPLTVRCGETDWFPASLCSPRLRAGAVPEPALVLVRLRLADLARGRTITTEDESTDFDAEYEEWIGDIARARESLLARGQVFQPEPPHVVRLESLPATPPASLATALEFSLAAEGGSLFAELGQALAGPGDTRYYEVPDMPGGKLLLVADPAGVRGVWEGPSELAPPLASVGGAGDWASLPWRSGPELRLHRTEQHACWVDGRAVFNIGTAPPRTLAVQL